MKIKLVFDVQFVGRIEDIVEVDANATEDEIKALFFKYLGIEFDENCYYEILD